jgi:hypothetical protein
VIWYQQGQNLVQPLAGVILVKNKSQSIPIDRHRGAVNIIE